MSVCMRRAMITRDPIVFDRKEEKLRTCVRSDALDQRKKRKNTISRLGEHFLGKQRGWLCEGASRTTEPLQELGRMDPWVRCLAVSEFDENEGPRIRSIYPEGVLSDATQKSLAMLSLPAMNRDSATNAVISKSFLLRVRTDTTVPYFSTSSKNHSYLYGYVHFKRVPTDQASRGCQQQSTILLTELPLPSFYN